MCRVGVGRLEAAAYLVFALRARLEAIEALLDAELDALVVAGLEMQAVEVFSASPIATVQRIAANKEHSHSDNLIPVLGKLEQQRLTHRAGDFEKRFGRQIRFVAASQEGDAVQLPGREDLLGTRLAATARLEGDAGLGDPSPLATRFLAFVCGEAAEEVLEVGVAAVTPVELAIATHQPFGIALEQTAVCLGWKENVGRGELLLIGVLGQRLDQLP